MTEARKHVSEDIDLLARKCNASGASRILFIGVDPKWDYRSLFFGKYETMDVRQDRKPDILGDIQQCDNVPDETYEAIIMTGVYEYLQYPDKAFEHINRMLKYNGVALICVPTEAYYSDKPTVEPEFAFKEIQPLQMVRMNVTWYRNQPYYLNIFAKKS